MRIRITKQPPEAYAVDRTPFHLGRSYNVDSALASALIAEGCAELDEVLTADERRERDNKSRSQIWEATDRKHAPKWTILNSEPKPPEPTDD